MNLDRLYDVEYKDTSNDQRNTLSNIDYSYLIRIFYQTYNCFVHSVALLNVL